MSNPSNPSQASFSCRYCQKLIYIPIGLPPTTAPCPHCGKEVVSPDQTTPVAPSPSPRPTGNAKPAAQDTKPLPNSAVLPPTKAKKSSAGPILIFAGVLLLLAAALAWWFSSQTDDPGEAKKNQPDPSSSKPVEASLWRHDVAKVLQSFMDARTPDERMKYCIPNPGVLEELQKFYPEGQGDLDTPFESFGAVPAAEEDASRGIFRMSYRQPPQIDIREFFGPIGSLDAVVRGGGASNLEMAHRIDDRSLSETVGIDAFFKKSGDTYLLDASTFIQGKYRTFKTFTEMPQPNKERVFRVLLNESVSHRYHSDLSTRCYRIRDFAYPKDSISVIIKADSQLGKTLAKINWRGTNKQATPFTATVRLKWSNSTPSRLELADLVCWEFLGVGGDPSNLQSQ